MRTLRIALCLAIAASCLAHAADTANSAVQPNLPRTYPHLGGGLALFAATVVEGGGVKANAKAPRPVVLDVSREFEKQHLPPGRVKLGKQPATWTAFETPGREQRDYESPVNGTRIIAFADPSGDTLKVYGELVFADSEANRANASLGRAPREELGFQGPFFFASLGLAFLAIFIAWYEVKYGAVALAASIALWIGYEVTIPTQVNIRVDLAMLFPLMLAAAISVAAAAIRSGRRSDPR